MTHIDLYIEQIDKGNIVVGKAIQDQINRHISDLKRSESDDFEYFFDEKEAQRVIDFLKILPDPKSGKPLNDLALFQKFIVSLIYGWKNKKTGYRRFKKVFITQARKGGKTFLVAGLACYNFYLENEPAKNRQIYFTANTREQSKIAFEKMAKPQIRALMKGSKFIRKKTRVTQQEIIFNDDEATMKALASDTNVLDGLDVSLGILDEYAYSKNESMLEVLQSSQVQQKQGLILIISTAGENLQSPMYQNELPYARKVASGEIVDDSYLPIIYEQDSLEEVQDESMWMKSNPILEVEEIYENTMIYLRTKLKEANEKGTTALTYIKNFNIWQNNASHEKIVDIDTWKTLDYEERKIEKPNIKGRDVFIGIDLSARGDLSSISWAIPIEEKKIIHVDSFSFIGYKQSIEFKEKQESIPYRKLEKQGFCRITTKESGYIDLIEVADFIKNFVYENELNVKSINYDSYNAQQIITELEDDFSNQLIETRQGFKTLNPAIQTFRTFVADNVIGYSKNPLLDVCLLNSEIIEQNNTLMIRKRDRNFTKKIDAMSALLNCFTDYELQHYKFDAPVFDINDYFNDFDISL